MLFYSLSARARALVAGLGILVSAADLAAQPARRIIPAALTDGVTEGGSSTGRPWSLGNVGNGIRVQNVYDTSHFVGGASGITGPVVIEGLRWRADGGATAAGGRYDDVSIVLGVAAVNHMQVRQNFDANFLGGVRPAPSYRGPVVVGAANGQSPGAFYIDVTLQTPFIYDPTQGDDLIIEIQHDGVFVGDAALSDAVFVTQQPMSTRVYTSVDPANPIGTVQFGVGLACELVYRPTGSLAANFRFAPARVGPGEVVQFTDASVSTHPMGIQFWSWDFDGDGITDSIQQNPSFTAGACSAGPVTLIVTDATGSRVRTLPGPVVGPPDTGFSFAASTTNPLDVRFTDTSGGAPTAWAWDFDGDGVADSFAQNPSFVFADPGRYDVSLDASNACGTTRRTIPVDLRRKLSTTFAGGNSLAGRLGGTHYFDVTVQPLEGVTLTALAIHGSEAGASAQVDVYISPGGFAGKTALRSAWVFASRGSGVVAGPGQPSEIDIDDVALPTGVFGVCVVSRLSSGDLVYTDGIGSGLTSFGSGEPLSLATGVVRDIPFGGAQFSPRVWNGYLAYDISTRGGVFSPYLPGCRGSNGGVPSLTLAGSQPPAIGQSFTVELAGARANANAFLMIGIVRPQALDLGLLSMPGCPLSMTILETLPIRLDGMGVQQVTLPINARPATAGLTFAFQAFVVDPGANGFGAVVSDAAICIIGS